MKKGIAFFIASIIIASLVFADELDDEIQKAEQANRLLELQNKNKELKSNKLLELRNKNKELKSNKQDLRSKANLKKTKNGIFIGIEGGLGTNNFNYDYKRYSHADGRVVSISGFSLSSTTFDLGLIGGYQHYFGESQRHGIKASAHIYSGFGNNWKREKKYQGLIGSYTRTDIYSYLPVKIGFDVKYLWDFLERGKHILGLNVGLGWEFDWYVKGVITTTRSNSSDKYTGKLETIFSNGFYPVVGLHYYYGHHQFEALYRFGGILENKGEYSWVTYNYFNDKIVRKDFLVSNSYFTLNYAYRF